MKYGMLGTMMAVFMITASEAEQPAPTYAVSIDTSVYDIGDFQYMTCMFFPSAIPMDATLQPLSNSSRGTIYQAFRKKGSTAVDIFSVSGKIGSVTLPLNGEAPQDRIPYIYMFSQTIIDADEGWECLRVVNGSNQPFDVFDDNGSQILTDSGTACYGFDGKDTYVIATRTAAGSYNKIILYKSWRFRSNIASVQFSPLSKRSSTFPQPMMTFGQAGNFQISLKPIGGGRTSVQLFDCIGRLIYEKAIDQITGPTTINVPEISVPKTPFIAKVRDENGNTARKLIPVR
jgi:hypothetical protein